MRISKRQLLLMGCAFAASFALHAQAPRADAAQAAAAGDEDCFAVGDTAKREACFARQSDDDIAECERTRPSACRPYKDMYADERRLQALNTQLLALANKQYASNSKDDPAYLGDLARTTQDADRAWRTWRDAECTAEPFLEGMSRQEAGNLTEACRAEKTKARIDELNHLISNLKP